jgi:hypothetical protein
MQQQEPYLVRFAVDYPDRPLDRLTTGYRIFVAIPILIVIGTVSGEEAGIRATTTPSPPLPRPAGCCSSGRC